MIIHFVQNKVLFLPDSGPSLTVADMGNRREPLTATHIGPLCKKCRADDDPLIGYWLDGSTLFLNSQRSTRVVHLSAGFQRMIQVGMCPTSNTMILILRLCAARPVFNARSMCTMCTQGSNASSDGMLHARTQKILS